MRVSLKDKKEDESAWDRTEWKDNNMNWLGTLWDSGPVD